MATKSKPSRTEGDAETTAFELTVREPFTDDGVDYARGVEITDPAVIARVLKSFAHHVVKRPLSVTLPQTPATA